jgi:hypothetical protein
MCEWKSYQPPRRALSVQRNYREVHPSCPDVVRRGIWPVASHFVQVGDLIRTGGDGCKELTGLYGLPA